MKLHLDTILLEMFIAIADTKSFSVASQIVGRTQPAVSLQIKKLEEQVGCELFKRSGNKVHLTRRGEIFLQYASSMIKSQLELQSILLNQNLQNLKIRIGLPEDIAAIYLSDILKSLHTLYPDIDLEINCDLTLNLIKAFNNNQYDIAIIKNDEELSAIYPHNLEVWNEPLLWVSHESYMMKDSISLIVSPEPCIYRVKTINILSKHNIPWKVQYTTHSLAGKIAALTAGFGICTLPSRILANHKSLINVEQKFGLPKLSDFRISILKNQNSNMEMIDVFSRNIINSLCS